MKLLAEIPGQVNSAADFVVGVGCIAVACIGILGLFWAIRGKRR